MFSEYNVVRLRFAGPTEGVPAGTRGTILVIHDDVPPAYEVEFINDAGDSLGTFTMKETDLELESGA